MCIRDRLEAASRLLPRALVLDRVLPRLRADDLAERLQESDATASLRLIVLAAREELGDSAKRFHGFVPKPLEHGALCAVLEDVLLGPPEPADAASSPARSGDSPAGPSSGFHSPVAG